MTKLLVVEDHQNLGSSLKTFLEKEGYSVDWVSDVTSAKSVFSSEHKLVILDWMLPDGQGIDLVGDLRKKGTLTPVIFLTARVDLVDKVLGLEMGANDYLTKPFEMRELLARIRVQLRNQISSTSAGSENQGPSTKLSVGNLEIDRVRHRVSFKGSFVDLVRKEYELLALLAESPEKVFSREEILNKVWGYDVYPTTRTVDTHVMLLRQKIHNDLIETVRAVGYRLKPL